MNKPTFVLSLALTFSALSGAVFAQDAETASAVDADQCMWDYFEERTPKTYLEGAELTVHFDDGRLEELVERCEAKTGTEAVTFKGVSEFRHTVRNITYDFK